MGAPHLHFLADPAVWHKIDLVRVRDRKAPGGWRYYAHLLTHQSGYACESTIYLRAPPSAHSCRPARRTGCQRVQPCAGLVSRRSARATGHRPDPSVTLSSSRQRTASSRTSPGPSAPDCSPRNTNPEQYGPSARQRKRAQRRAAKGLRVKQVTNPGGPRAARADGVPLRAYRRDTLSAGYRRVRCDHAAHTRRCQ